MAATGTPTTNIGLRRPQGTDPASVDDINYNSELIDTKLGAVGSTSVQEQINTLNSNLAGFDGKRMLAANRSSILAIITVVTATANNSISIVGTNTAVCNTLGGGQDSGMMVCKYFANDNIINYVIIGRQIAIGKINTSTEEVTIVKQYT